MRAWLLSCTLPLAGCVLDYDALRATDASIPDAHPTTDAEVPMGDAEVPIRDAEVLDASGMDASRPDTAVPDSGVGDAGGDQLAWAQVLDPCPSGWDVIGDEYFEGDLSGWTAPLQGSFEAGHGWRIESGGAVVDMDGEANYWDRHLLRSGFQEADYAVMVDFSPEDPESWPQIHLRVDPAAPSSRFYGVRLNSDRTDLQVAVQDSAANAGSYQASSSFQAAALGQPRRLVAMIKNDGGDVVVRAALHELDDQLVNGSLVEFRYQAQQAYTAPGGFGLSGWVGQTRFEHVRFFACR